MVLSSHGGKDTLRDLLHDTGNNCDKRLFSVFKHTQDDNICISYIERVSYIGEILGYFKSEHNKQEYSYLFVII
jgi:hypothetical protein